MNNLTKLTALSFAGLGLLGCNAEDEAPEGLNSSPAPSAAIYDPTIAQMPTPNDLFFSESTDLTLNLPGETTNAAIAAANSIDGWSTIAPATIKFNSEIDESSLAAGVNVRIFRSCSAPSPRPEGLPETVRIPHTLPIPSNSGGDLEELTGGDHFVVGTSKVTDTSNGFADDAIVKITFLKPLKPKFDPASIANCAAQTAQYLVFFDNSIQPIKDKSGNTIGASDFYTLAKSPDCLHRGSASDSSCPLPADQAAYAEKYGAEDDGSVGLTPAGKAAGLENAAEGSQIKTEGLRRITNLHEGRILQFAQDTARPLMSTKDVILSWTFSPQSIGTTLQAVNAMAESATDGANAAGAEPTLFYTGKDIGQLSGNAEQSPLFNGHVFFGNVTLPYYSHSPATGNPLTSNWVANSNNGGSTHLTYENPTPVKRSDINAQVFAVVPKALPDGTGGYRPITSTDKLPVVIVQHGITVNRFATAAIAESLAKAGMISIAIDLPLHGVVKGDPTFGPLYSAGKERHFDLFGEYDPDDDEKVSSAIAQGFLGLSTLVTGRDNIRQAVADLLYLEETIDALSIVRPTGPETSETINVDPDRIYFVGHSLGGIVGTTYLANSDKVKAATLAMAGGGIAKLLDASARFGPTISGSLEKLAGIKEGEKAFEDFLMFAQLAVDSGDPVNTIQQLRAARPDMALNIVEVVGGGGAGQVPDTVVPNNAFTTAGSDDPVPQPGLGGTDPMIAATEGVDIVEPTDQRAKIQGVPVIAAIKFDRGNHGSIATPDPTDPTDPGTQMLQQTAEFFLFQGTCIPRTQSCFAP